VMIIQGKRGPQLRVLDFGIAKLMQRDEHAGTGHTATRSTFNAFSPQYAAPEQIGGSRTGPWTDVHALGLVFVEALTGRQPYGDSEDVTALFQEILSPVRPTPAKFGVDGRPLPPMPGEPPVTATELGKMRPVELPAAAAASA